MIRGMRTTSCPFLSLDIITTDGKFLYQATQKISEPCNTVAQSSFENPRKDLMI